MATSNSYNSGTFEDTLTLFAPKLGVFGVGQFNSVLQIYPWLTLVAMATNNRYLDRELAITRLVCEIQPPFLHLVGGFHGRAI